MNRDCQLIFEVYKKVNPNEYRFPIKPKFNIGDTVAVKYWKCSKYVGVDNFVKDNWEFIEYKNLIGKVIEIKSYQVSRPIYYYEILIEDKRFPEILGQTFIFAGYELRKTKLTIQDTQTWSDLLDI